MSLTMRSASSRRVIYAAIASNLAIAVCKYIAASVTGSPPCGRKHSTPPRIRVTSCSSSGGYVAVRARPIHCIRSDTGKCCTSIRCSWPFTFSVLAECWPCGQGVVRFRQPEQFTHVGWNYIVLAAAFALDFYSWRISYKEILARKDPDESTWQEIIGSKDPTVFTIFLEDSAGMAGTVLAFLGMFFAHVLGHPYFDALASILIGILLAGVAALLGRESGALLVGERTNRSRICHIRAIICADHSVDNVGDLLTMQLGPDQVLLNVDIRFNRGLGVQELESAIDRIEKNIRQSDPTVQRIFIEVDSLRTASSRSFRRQNHRHHPTAAEADSN